MAGRSYFFSIFTVVLLTGGLTTAVDPQAMIGLLIGFGKALASVLVILLFCWLLIGLGWLASLRSKG